MTQGLLTAPMREFFEKNEFVYLATTDAAGRPYVIPKFLIKTDKDIVYLADFVFGRTIENIKVCPRVSFSLIDMESLMGYQMNGTARLIETGTEYNKLFPHLSKRQMHFSVERILEGVQRGKKHKSFEAAFPDRFMAIEITVEEVVDVFPGGQVVRRSKKMDSN